MIETDIRAYAELMRELELTGLEVTVDNSRVRLERSVAAAAIPAVTMPAAAVAGGAATIAAGVQAPVEMQAAAMSRDTISVTSPIVGVFYAAPAENAEPYVKVGDHVNKGQMLCIVEAMKLMNEIASDYDGEIAEICVTDGQVVEYGTELFRIRR